MSQRPHSQQTALPKLQGIFGSKSDHAIETRTSRSCLQKEIHSEKEQKYRGYQHEAAQDLLSKIQRIPHKCFAKTVEGANGKPETSYYVRFSSGREIKVGTRKGSQLEAFDDMGISIGKKSFLYKRGSTIAAEYVMREISESSKSKGEVTKNGAAANRQRLNTHQHSIVSPEKVEVRKATFVASAESRMASHKINERRIDASGPPKVHEHEKTSGELLKHDKLHSSRGGRSSRRLEDLEAKSPVTKSTFSDKGLSTDKPEEAPISQTAPTPPIPSGPSIATPPATLIPAPTGAHPAQSTSSVLPKNPAVAEKPKYDLAHPDPNRPLTEKEILAIRRRQEKLNSVSTPESSSLFDLALDWLRK